MIDAAVRYQELVDGGLLAVFDSTIEGRLRSCNDAFARILGYPSASEAIGRDVTGCYADLKDRALFLERVRSDRLVDGMHGRLRTVAGEIRYVLLTGIGEFDGSDRLVAVRGYIIDITDGIHAQLRLQRRERELEERLAQAQKLETIGRLAGGVAHDFNNLLTAILGYAELLAGSPRVGDAERADIEEIRRAGQRAASLTQQLLAFSRRQMLIPKEVDVNGVVMNLRSMLTRLIREDITLTCEAAPEPAIACVDPTQLEQVVMNLVLNARDALPSAGWIRVDVACVSAASVRPPADVGPLDCEMLVRLRVSDNGVGIAPEAQRHLFEPFFTTKGVGQGTGLGLASVYGVVRQSNGFVTVDSAPGAGSTFVVYLPLVATSSTSAGANPGAGSNGGATTVLLVEDEPAVRTIVAAGLRRHGFRVLEAEGPSAAWPLFDAHRDEIEVLVTDVVMPETSGPALAQRLVGARPDLRVLFISGYADALRPLDIGHPLVSFLGKPFEASALVATVRELLARGPQPHTRTTMAAS
ncbi:MAG TPA: ATP-binding protein [Vicinamibacterales bacterium]|nr:ATP-binding protein [Vicinamibacterales bacterium]